MKVADSIALIEERPHAVTRSEDLAALLYMSAGLFTRAECAALVADLTVAMRDAVPTGGGLTLGFGRLHVQTGVIHFAPHPATIRHMNGGRRLRVKAPATDHAPLMARNRTGRRLLPRP